MSDDLLASMGEEEAAKAREYLRPAWKPQVEDGDSSGPVSKIAGRPWLTGDAEWPTCPNCDQAMQLLVQLDLSSLPEGAPGRAAGLAQLFYCTNDDPLCEDDCEAWSPFAESVMARIIDREAPGRQAEAREVPNELTAKNIVGWERDTDLPSVGELLGEHGVPVDYDDPLGRALQETKRPLAGTKLGGWPLWVQGVEYPACPECGEKMRLLLQIDSDNVVGMQWGDVGCAHWTQCSKHPERMAFAWACC